MNKIIGVILLFALPYFVIAIIGCENNTQPGSGLPSKAVKSELTPLQPDDPNTIHLQELLPPNTLIIEDLGNKWYIVEINKKKFLFGYWYGSHGEKGFTITQLKISEFLPHLEDE